MQEGGLAVRLVRVMPFALALGVAAVLSAPAAGAQPDDAESRIAEIAHAPSSGVYSVWLGNGVRLHHRSEPAPDDGGVVVCVTLAGGGAIESDDQRGLTRLSERMLEVIGERVEGQAPWEGFRASSGGDSLQVSVRCEPAALEESLVELVRMLEHPRPPEREFLEARDAMADSLERARKSRWGRLNLAIAEGAAGADWQVAYSPEQLRAHSVRDATSWLRRLASGPMEVAIVGPVEARTALTTGARVLGELPERERIGLRLMAQERDPGRLLATRTMHLEPPEDPEAVGVLVTALPGVSFEEGLEPHRVRWVLARIWSERAAAMLGECGLIESKDAVGGRSLPGSVGRGPGLVSLLVWTRDPDAASDVVDAALASLRADPPTREEVIRVRGMLAQEGERVVGSSRYIASMLARSTYMGSTPDEIVLAPDSYRAVTPADIVSALESTPPGGPVLRVLMPPGKAGVSNEGDASDGAH